MSNIFFDINDNPLDDTKNIAMVEQVIEEQKKKPRKRFSISLNTKDYYVSPYNAAMLTAAKIVAEREGFSVVYVHGPSGWGKTSLGVHFANKIGWDHVIFPATNVEMREEWFTVREIVNGETVHVPTPFAEALEKDHIVIIIDEISRLEPPLLNPLISLLHDSGDGIHMHGKTFAPKKPTIFMMTANIGAEYVGTNEVDVALESRLHVQLKIDSIPPKKELNIVKNRIKEIDDKLAEQIVSWVRFLRKNTETTRDTSPRFTLNLARIAATGLPEKYLAKMVLNTIEDHSEQKQFNDFLNSNTPHLFDEEDEDEDDEY